MLTGSGTFGCHSTTEVKPFTITFRDARQVSEEEFFDMTEGGRLPTRDDIIYSRNVSVGSAARVREQSNFCMGQDICLIRPLSVRSDFLEFVLNSRAVRRIGA
jgi:type I restriction enzyme, S subunit